MKNQNTQENLMQEGINTQDEDYRQIENEVSTKPEDKNDSVQLSSRHLQYEFAKRHLRREPRPKVFPLGGGGGETKDLVYAQKADREIARIYDPAGLAPTLHLKTGGWQEPKIALALNEVKFRQFETSNISQTVKIGGDVGRVLTPETKVRRLTPTECEKLQGFPPGWTKYGINEKGETVEISDTQRYKVLGNAVTTNVITAIGERLINT